MTRFWCLGVWWLGFWWLYPPEALLRCTARIAFLFQDDFSHQWSDGAPCCTFKKAHAFHAFFMLFSLGKHLFSIFFIITLKFASLFKFFTLPCFFCIPFIELSRYAGRNWIRILCCGSLFFQLVSMVMSIWWLHFTGSSISSWRTTWFIDWWL